MGKVNNIIGIPSSLQGNFFNLWLQFLRPLHGLTDGEIKVVAAFLKERYELSKSITDPVILDKVTFSSEIKDKIKKEYGLTNAYLLVVLSKLKKKNILTVNGITPKLIPRVDNPNSYTLMIAFNLDDRSGDNKAGS